MEVSKKLHAPAAFLLLKMAKLPIGLRTEKASQSEYGRYKEQDRTPTPQTTITWPIKCTQRLFSLFGTHFCYRLSKPQAGRIRYIEKCGHFL
jgi:hypothetical protein